MVNSLPVYRPIELQLWLKVATTELSNNVPIDRDNRHRYSIDILVKAGLCISIETMRSVSIICCSLFIECTATSAL